MSMYGPACSLCLCPGNGFPLIKCSDKSFHLHYWLNYSCLLSSTTAKLVTNPEWELKNEQKNKQTKKHTHSRILFCPGPHGKALRRAAVWWHFSNCTAVTQKSPEVCSAPGRFVLEKEGLGCAPRASSGQSSNRRYQKGEWRTVTPIKKHLWFHGYASWNSCHLDAAWEGPLQRKING